MSVLAAAVMDPSPWPWVFLMLGCALGWWARGQHHHQDTTPRTWADVDHDPPEAVSLLDHHAYDWQHQGD